MTTLAVVDGAGTNETRAEAVARRLRGELGMRNIRVAAAARLCDVTQAWMSRRINGAVPFDIADLDMICATLGISFEYVATGIRALPGTSGPGESKPVGSELCPASAA